MSVSRSKYDPALSLVKVLAMLLIIQSHSDKLFPASISFLATGGALGNELFFLVGGYLYSIRNDVWKTTAKRFIRLYIPTYMMTIALYVFGIVPGSNLLSFGQIINSLIWPTHFWFVSAIFLFGILLHIFVNAGLFSDRKKILLSFAGLLLIWLMIYVKFVSPKDVWIVEDVKLFGGTFYFKCIYSFAVFCIGYGLKLYLQKEKIHIKEGYISFAGAVFCFLCFYGFKFILNKRIIPMELQILSQPLTVISVLFIFLWIKNSTVIQNVFLKNAMLTKVVNEMGGITLEAFLVQFELIRLISGIRIVFPINYVLAMGTILICAYSFYKINQKICGYLMGWCKL